MVAYQKHLASPLDYRYADEYSKFSQKRELKYAYSPNSSSPVAVTTSVSYYIDGNEVDEQTFTEVMDKVRDSYEIITNKKCDFQIVEDGIGETTWKLNIGDDNMNWLDYIKPVNKNGVKRGYRSDATHEQYSHEPHILCVDTDDIIIIYSGIDKQAYVATKKSMFETNVNRVTGEFRGIPLIEIATGMRFMIDNVEVSRATFEKVRDLLKINTIYGDGKRADSVYFDEFYHNERENADMMTISDTRTNSEKSIDSIIEDCERLSNEILANWYLDAITNKYHRKDNNMITNIPKIVDYKYIAENGVSIIKWSDNTSTTVTCDPKTADQYTGFVTAIAKKAFGNGGKMLSEWDRLVIKPVEDAKKAEEKAKIEAEKKAKEDKIHAEAKAKRDAKKAERKKKRKIEKLAKQIADEYYAQELTGEAEKLAIKKYGVPKSYLDDYDCGCDNCNCNEFDVMDDENITD